MRRIILSVTLILSAATSVAYDNEDDPRFRNVAKLKVEITTDRRAYFPGEYLLLRFSLYNSGLAPLDVPDPFASGGPAIVLLQRNGIIAKRLGLEWGEANPDVAPKSPSAETPTLRLQPGQRIERTFPSSQTPNVAASESGVTRNRVELAFPTGGAPATAGQYKLQWYYRGIEETSFEVVQPIVEGFAAAPGLERTHARADGERFVVRGGVLSVVYAYGTERHLCVGMRETDTFQPGLLRRAMANGPNLSAFRWFSPCRRVFTTTGNIEGLQSEQDAAGNVTLTWRGDNAPRLLRLTPAREVQ